LSGASAFGPTEAVKAIAGLTKSSAAARKNKDFRLVNVWDVYHESGEIVEAIQEQEGGRR
jgi:hypothetical protein